MTSLDEFRPRLKTTARYAVCVSAAVVATMAAAASSPTIAGRPSGDVAIETFQASAFPYDGPIPEQDKPFLEGPPEARFHIAPRGGKLMAARTYFDRRSLLALPTRFDPSAPGAAIILFFHGNLATLKLVKEQQGVPRQLFESGLNAALVAPQLAVDALDSSPGRFWEDGFLGKYLSDAEDHLVALAKGRFAKSDLVKLPVVIVAYSGGYLATAFSLHYAGAESRIRGVVLLDALFGETPKIQDWIAKTQPNTFFFSAFSKASASENASLEASLARADVPIQTALSGPLSAGDVVFVAATKATHNDFVTRAWVSDPLTVVLSCIRITRDTPNAPTCRADATSRGGTTVRPMPSQPSVQSSPQGLSDCPADAPSCDPAAGRPVDRK